MACYAFEGFTPVVAKTAFIHPLAAVIGNVVIGEDCYIGPGAVLRADWGGIVLEDGCNVQENCTVHMFPGVTTVLRKGAHIGHGAVIHGAVIGENCLVGMNAVVMDNVVLGTGCIVGALSFLKADAVFPDRSLIAGNPAKIIKDVSEEMLQWKTEGTKLYQGLPARMYTSLTECEPLREMPAERKTQDKAYKTLNDFKSGS